MSILHHVTIVVDNPPKPSQLHKIGWNHYCNGLPINTLATEAEKRGWMAANKAEAEAATDGWAERMRW